MNRAIIYVSSNMEDPDFEQKTREDLLSKAGDIPIISVTQEPVDLGINICIGEVGASGYNFCRQVEIACENTDADIVISAESDCLYSPDYFWFTPESLDIPYRNTNIYVQKYKEDFWNKKSSSTFSQVIGRKFYLERLKYLFGDGQTWDTSLKNWPKEWGKVLFGDFAYFETEFPCLSFKTGRGMRKHSPTGSTPVFELPYWGTCKEVKNKYGVR